MRRDGGTRVWEERKSECVEACMSGRISKTVEGGMEEDKTYPHSLPTHEPSHGRWIMAASRPYNRVCMSECVACLRPFQIHLSHSSMVSLYEHNTLSSQNIKSVSIGV